MKLKLGLPAGSLQESTVELFKSAGFNIYVSNRSYVPVVDDDELDVRLIRAQEIPRYVANGHLDAGITGKDWLLESGKKVNEVLTLCYAKQGRTSVKWVLAVPVNSKVKRTADLKGKKVATELVNVTREYFRKKKVNADVEFSWGATEAKPPDLADAVVDVTETGISLSLQRLRIIDVVLESAPVLIANGRVWQNNEKRKKIENIGILLRGALQAREKVGLKMNLPKDKFKKISAILPSLRKPTISPLTDTKWLALEVVVDEKIVRKIIPELKRAGAEGIIEYPLNKLIY